MDLQPAKHHASFTILLKVYFFVVALATEKAMSTVATGFPESPVRNAAIGAAFLSIMIPFVHGTWRHFEANYTSLRTQKHAVVLVMDFGFVFVQATLLLAMAQHVETPHGFLTAASAILTWDFAYGFIMEMILDRVSPDRGKKGHLGVWAALNLVTAGILALILTSSGEGEPSTSLLVLVSLGLVVRTLMDYRAMRDLYFPECAICREAPAAS